MAPPPRARDSRGRFVGGGGGRAGIIKTGQWSEAERILREGPLKLRDAIHRAVLQEAHFLRGKIIEGLDSQSPGGRRIDPLADSTLAVRRFLGFRGTKALIRRADLRNGFTVRSPGHAQAFIGVLRSARGRDGHMLANVAEVQEFGSRPIVIPITPKMRRFLAAALGKQGGSGGGGGGTGIIVTRVPARPFIRPVIEKYGSPDQLRQRFAERLVRLLGGDFGR